MTDSVYHPATRELAQRRKELSPGVHEAFEHFSRAVFAEGALHAMQEMEEGSDGSFSGRRASGS